MTRRLRKYPQHHPSEGEPHTSGGGRRTPYGLIWLILTVIVLVLVILYDRRSINDAERHISTGKELERKGLFMEALSEYDQAFHNRRLGRKAKAGAALSMAEIYFTHLEDFPAAHQYYVQAKQESPTVFSTRELQEHAKTAAARAQGSGVFKSRNNAGGAGSTTATIVQRVELISEPMQDKRGPVLARYNGGEIHAGQVLRELQHRPEFHSPEFRENPEKLRQYMQNALREEMAYQAAVSAGVHKDADLSARLYDYQKQLITQRYLVDRRDLAMKVDNTQVEQYYKEHKDEFVKPGSIQISMIKATSETSATELLDMLRKGAAFQDVATSYSADKSLKNVGGSLGIITEGQTSIPGVGEAPDLVKGLFQLPVHSVSEVVPVGDAFYIFKINSVTPTLNITLDEARGRIENHLRGKAVDVARHNLDAELQQAFDPKLDEDKLKQFWEYVQENTVAAEAGTSGTQTAPASAASSATQAILSDHKTTAPDEAATRP
jgi:parvulin-like peptidyl-prolyl isomerase